MGIMLDLMERGDSAALDLIADTGAVLKWYCPQFSTCTDNEGVFLTMPAHRRDVPEVVLQLLDLGFPGLCQLDMARRAPVVDCSDPAVQAWALAHWPSEWKPR